MNKLMIVFAILLLLPTVIAQPPFVQEGDFARGLDIKYPNRVYINQNQGYEFEFHVFNHTTGTPETEDIICYFHLYNSSGKHIAELEDNTPSHMFDYSFDIDAGNFTTKGSYTYVIQCNSSVAGGFDSVAFEVTENGESGDLHNIGLIIALLTLVITCLVLGWSFGTKYWLLKTFFYFCAVLGTLISINASRFMSTSQQEIFQMGDMGLLVSIILFAVFFIFMFVYAFIEIIKAIKEKRGVRWSYD